MREMAAAESTLGTGRKERPGARVHNVEAEVAPMHHRCPECEWVFAVEGQPVACPRCGSDKTSPVSAKEVEGEFFDTDQG